MALLKPEGTSVWAGAGGRVDKEPQYYFFWFACFLGLNIKLQNKFCHYLLTKVSRNK